MNIRIALCLFVSPFYEALAWESAVSYSVQPVFYDYNHASFAAVTQRLAEQPDFVSKQLLEVSADSQRFSLTATARQRFESHVNSQGGSHVDSQHRLKLKELIYTTDIAEWDFSAGKKISSWGVGMAYRPLDVIQTEDLLSTDHESLEGVNQVSLEGFGETSSFGIHWVYPDSHDEQESIVFRYTQTGASSDWQALLRYGNQNGLQVGTGVSYILTDALELHASALYLSKYSKMLHPLAGQNRVLLSEVYPWEDVRFTHGFNGMIGGNFTWHHKHNILFEYWHNSQAWTESQWRDHIQLMNQQKSLLTTLTPVDAVEGNLAWSMAAFSHQNLVQDNVFLCYQYQGADVTPQASILYSPSDSGCMTNLEMMFDVLSMKLTTGIRHYSGDDRSVYGLLPVTSQLYLSVYGDF